MGKLADRRQISTLVKHHGPVVLMRDADAAGIARAVIRRMLDSGELWRLGKSAFALTDTMNSASGWEAFRLRSIGFALTLQEGTFLTGAAAAAVLGLPMLSDPPALPVALRDGSAHRGHRITPYGTVRHSPLGPQHRMVRSGVPVVGRAYCAIDVARHFGSRDGLVVADAVMHAGTSREELAAITWNMDRYPGIDEARWVVEHADPRAESPLESLGRFAFLAAGRPAPISNPWIQTAGGKWYRVDHLMPDTGVILEADGAVKYDDQPKASLLVAKDREREELLRELGFGLARYTWSIAERRPGLLLRRADQAAVRRGTRPPPSGWTLDSPYGGLAL